MATSIQVVVTARDEASRTVDAFKSKLKDMDVSATEATRGVRELTRGVLSELSPALASVTTQVALVTRGASALGLGMGGLAVGVAAGVASLLPFITATKEAADTQARLNLAARTFDAGPIRAQLTAAAQDIEATRLRFQTFSGTLVNIGRAVTDWIGYTTAAAETMKQAREALSRVLPIEGEQQLTQVLVQQRQAAEQLATVDLPKFARREDLQAATQALQGVTSALGQQEAAQRRIIELEAQQALARAKALGEGPESETNIRRLRDARLQLLDEHSQLQFSQASNQAADVLAGIRTAQAQGDAARINVLLQEIGLTKEYRAQLQLQAIEADRVAKVEAARDNPRLVGLANEEAAVKRVNVLRGEAERTDLIQGLVRGLTDAEIEFGAVGLRMQSLARSVADGMSQSFSDGFFDVITGNFKDLPNVARSFTNSMVRAVTDELAKLVTAPILGQLRNLLGTGALGAALTIAPGAGGGGGGLLDLVGAAPAQAAGVTPTYLLSTAGRPIPAAELSTAYAAGGESAVRTLQAGRATVAGGQYLPDYSPELTQSAYQLSQPSTLGSRALSAALPAAGSALALGLSAYGAHGAQSASDVAISAALGGLAGAGLGRAIGSIFDASGFGTGAGALAGAAINTTLALLAKQQADAQALKTRQAAEAANAVGAGAALASSASGATSVADLQRRITAFGLGSTGGTGSVAVPVTVQTPAGTRLIGTDLGQDPVASVLDLLRNPSSLQATILAGVSPAIKGPQEAATSTALQGMATDLAAQFRKTEQGVGVTQTEGLGGLVRRTTVPASRADSLVATGDVAIDQLALDALSSDDRAVLLLDVLSRVAADKDIASTISDPETGQIVSITRIARSTIGLPGGTVPAPPAPTPAPAPPPGLSTGNLLTVGGGLALGLASQLLDPTSFVNSILPAGYTGTDLANFIKSLFAPSTAAEAATAASIAAAGQAAFDAGATGFGEIAGPSIPSGVEGGGTSGLGTALDVAGGLKAIFDLTQGVTDPLSLAQSVLAIYNALAGVANFAGLGATLPTVGSLLSSGVGSIESAIGSIASTAAGGGAPGAEAAASAVAAVGNIAAVAAPIVAGLIVWALTKDQAKDAQSWAVIGQTATMMFESAFAAVQSANQAFAGLRGAGSRNLTAIQQALTIGGNALFLVYRSVDGPGAPINIASYFKFTKQDPGPFNAAVALLTQNMKDAIAELERQGVTPQQLGQLPITPQVGELLPSQPFSQAILTGTDYAALAPQYQVAPYQTILGGGEGGTAVWNWVDANGVAHTDFNPPPLLPTPDQVQANVALGAGINQSRGLTPAEVNAEYGGPLWALMKSLAGTPPGSPAAVSTPVIGPANPWLAGGAAPGAIVAPTASEKPLTLAEVLQLLQVAASVYGAFSGGGAGDSGSGSSPSPGQVGGDVAGLAGDL